MNTPIKLFLISALISVSALGCLGKGTDDATSTDGSSDGSGGGSSTPKALNRVWTIPNGAWTLDLTNARVDNQNFNAIITMSNGTSKCTVVMKFNGSSSSGTCTWVSSTHTGGTNPGCVDGSGNDNFGMCPTLIGGGTGYTMDGTNFKFSGGASYN